MITRDDVAAVFNTRLGASSDFTSAVPGSAYLDRGPDQPTYPFGVFRVKALGEPEVFSDLTYTQAFEVSLGVYATAAMDPQTVQLAMVSAVNGSPTSWPALRAGRVLHCIPQAFDGEAADRLRQASDVFVCGGKWQLLCEGTLTP